jgi:hypothetical protein
MTSRKIERYSVVNPTGSGVFFRPASYQLENASSEKDSRSPHGSTQHEQIDSTADCTNGGDDGNENPEIKVRSGYADFMAAFGALAPRVVERFRSTLMAARIAFQFFPLTAHGALAGSLVPAEIAITFFAFVNWTVLPRHQPDCSWQFSSM